MSDEFVRGRVGETFLSLSYQLEILILMSLNGDFLLSIDKL